jgi:hypothetical protein
LALRLVAIVFALGLLAPLERPAHACAPAPRQGETVQVQSEDALIVWDSRTKTEHFIRRASFQTASKDFGFLVPTPSAPKLTEAPDVLFDRLNEHVKPEVKHTRPIRFEPTGLLLGMRKSASVEASAASVTVLSESRVAGLDATVLEANDATALGKWLEDHGYAFRNELTSWVEQYVKDKWKITAFKIARADTSAALGTKAVKMSFTTERPFFPYREPDDQRTPAASGGFRLLRVFFLSNERVTGELANPGGWPGKASWAGAVKDAPSLFSGALGIEEIPPAPVLTTLDDRSSPRPGVADVFFVRDADQRELRPPPVTVEDPIVIPVPLELVGLFGCASVVIVAVFAMRRMRQARD